MRRSLFIGGSSSVQWRKVGRSWRLNILPLGGMTIAYRPIWLEHCGCVRHTCLPIASSDHVIRSIGRFKLVIDLRHHASRNLFLTCGTCFKIYSTAENIIIVSLNTVIPNIVIVKLGKVTWCLHKRIIYSHPVLATFFNVVFWVMHTAYWHKSVFSVVMCLSRQVDSLVSRLRKDNGWWLRMYFRCLLCVRIEIDQLHCMNC